MSVSLTGSDVIQIDGRTITDLADQDCVMLAFPEDVAKLKSSKNGNTLFAKNEPGRQMDVTLRVMLGSADDRYLNSRLQEQENDFSNFILLTSSFSKRVGDGKGGMSTKVYQGSAGIFKKKPEAKTSAEGDTENSVSIYNLTFGQSSISVQ